MSTAIRLSIVICAALVISMSLALDQSPSAHAQSRSSHSLSSPSLDRPNKERRVALIVTNQAYTKEAGRLNEPHEDGKRIRQALIRTGFDAGDIEHHKDVDRPEFYRALRTYRRRLHKSRDAGEIPIGFFYYSGHGVALSEGDGAENYLLPVRPPIKSADDAESSAVSLSSVVNPLKRLRVTNFVVIDACRNVAFSPGAKGGTKGLVPPPSVASMMIVFATQPGNVAIDGPHFSTSLADQLSTSQLPAILALRRVRRYVLNQTGGKQMPWVRDGLLEDFYFLKPASAPKVPIGTNAPSPSPPLLAMKSAPALTQRERDLHQKALAPGHCAEDILCPDMVELPPGSFDIKSIDGSKRTITIARPFLVSRHEITFAQYDACAKGGGCASHEPSDNGLGRTARAVTNITWQQAMAYVHWLKDKTGKPYRLLTEAEWEYASRGGTRTSDDQDRPTHAQSGYVCVRAKKATVSLGLVRDGCDDGYVRQAPRVGRDEPNGFGLYDMAGGVSEWVRDCYSDEGSDLPEDASARNASPNCLRTLRGASWRAPSANISASLRRGRRSSFSTPTIGFRAAMDIDPRTDR